MRKAKIASVGCGWVAKRWHLPTIAELTKRGDLDYIAVCDGDADTAREAGEDVRSTLLYGCRGDAGKTQ